MKKFIKAVPSYPLLVFLVHLHVILSLIGSNATPLNLDVLKTAKEVNAVKNLNLLKEEQGVSTPPRSTTPASIVISTTETISDANNNATVPPTPKPVPVPKVTPKRKPAPKPKPAPKLASVPVVTTTTTNCSCSNSTSSTVVTTTKTIEDDKADPRRKVEEIKTRILKTSQHQKGSMSWNDEKEFVQNNGDDGNFTKTKYVWDIRPVNPVDFANQEDDDVLRSHEKSLETTKFGESEKVTSNDAISTFDFPRDDNPK